MTVPILRLRGLLLTALQADMSDEEALEFQGHLLRTLTATGAQGVAIDISAMDVMDPYMVRVVNETARVVATLGAEVVLCGMQPEVAQTVIEMGQELVSVETTLNLDQAVGRLEALIERRHG